MPCIREEPWPGSRAAHAAKPGQAGDNITPAKPEQAKWRHGSGPAQLHLKQELEVPRRQQ